MYRLKDYLSAKTRSYDTEHLILSNFGIQIKAIITSIQAMNKIPYENI